VRGDELSVTNCSMQVVQQPRKLGPQLKKGVFDCTTRMTMHTAIDSAVSATCHFSDRLNDNASEVS